MNNIHLEELAMNAWPALQTVLYDGWIVRFANGYTKRANSVTPLYPGMLAVEEKIDWCEQHYQQAGLRPTFRLTQATETDELDTALAHREYERIDTTSVQTMNLGQETAVLSPHASLFSEPEGRTEWLQLFHKLDGGLHSDDRTHLQMLGNIRGEAGYMVLTVEGKVVACGLGVVERGWLGIFDVVTAVSHRNKGYGAELMQSLLAWGQTNNAHHTYLQVMTNHPAALNLYAKLGYKEQYQYWYRVLN
jgi:GNAT superfamily N-acetyltransferase